MRRIVHVSDLRIDDLVEFPVGCVGPRVWRVAAIRARPSTGSARSRTSRCEDDYTIEWGAAPFSGWAQPKPWSGCYTSRTFVCVPMVVHRREAEQRSVELLGETDDA